MQREKRKRICLRSNIPKQRHVTVSYLFEELRYPNPPFQALRRIDLS